MQPEARLLLRQNWGNSNSGCERVNKRERTGIGGHPDMSRHVQDERSQSAYRRLSQSSVNLIADNAVGGSSENEEVAVWVSGHVVVHVDEELHETVAVCLHHGPAGVACQDMVHVAAAW